MKNSIDIAHIVSLFEGTEERGNIYLGSVSVLSQLQGIKEKHVDCILSILDDWAYPKFRVRERIEEAKISVSHRINLQDDEEVSIFPEL